MHKVVVQINSSDSGSTGSVMKAVDAALTRCGYASYMFFGLGKSDGKRLFRISNGFDVRLHNKLSCLTGFHGWFSVLPTLRLLWRLDRLHPDVVHIHNLHGGYVNYPLFLGYLARHRIRTIVTMHDLWLLTGGCVHYTAVGCLKWKTLCKDCTQKNRYPKSWFFDTTALCYQVKGRLLGRIPSLTVTTVSRWVAQQAGMSHLKNRTIIPVYNSVDTEVFHPIQTEVLQRMGLEGKRVLLGVASTWSNSKGLAQFVQLAQRLPQTYVVMLVGVDERVKRGLPDRIFAVEATRNRDELAELYSAAEVFLNLSIEETFGLTTAEAMACGTPVIVSNTTANPEIIDETCGFAVDVRKIDCVIDAIEKIEEHGKEKYRVACRRRVIHNFTAGQMAEGYLNVYKHVLNG